MNSPQADAMPSTIETESPPTNDIIPTLQVPQYRPTVISLNTHFPVNTSSAHSLDEDEPIQVPEKPVMEDHTPSPPRPLVPPPEGERPERMRDWLVRIINSGRIPGLRWLDDEKAIFRVPWIHAKKRDYNQERDAALFREWAIHSGKYGDGSDVTTWKINFRCALNGLKDIIERRDLEEPDCRVYQMLPCSSTGRRRKRRRVFYPPDAAGYQGSEVRPRIDHGSPVTTPTYPLTPTTAPGTPFQVLPIVTAGMQVRLPLVASPTTPHTMPTITSPFGILQSVRPTLFHPHPLHPLHPSPMATALPSHIPMVTKRKSSSPPLSRDGSGSQPPTPRTPLSPQQQSPRVLSPHGSTRTVELITFPPPSHALHSAHQLPHVVPSPLRTGPVFCPPQQMCNSPTAIVVRVLYGSITVHMETVDCTGGTRIFYGPLHCRDVLPPEQEERLFGPLKAHQIQLTPRHPAPIAKDMFDTIKRGLIIEVENGCVYATALCRAVVYFGSSPVRHTGTLGKEDRTKLFNYNHRFLPSLKQTGPAGSGTPKPYVIFSFGQPWGGERALSKNLVTVVVTYCRALNDFRVKNSVIHDELLFEAQESKDIRIISPTQTDIEAEAFLNPGRGGGGDQPETSPR